jgi:group I intron endonuclease
MSENIITKKIVKKAVFKEGTNIKILVPAEIEVKDENTSKNVRDMLRDIKLDTPEDRWYVIYVITNNVDNKQYVGQAVSHIKIKEKYIPYGAEGRLLAHFREANSKKVHQCAYLNNAIRDHGKENFTVKTLVECEKEQVDELEIKYIQEFNSMFPHGYNIMRGGRKIDGYIEKGNVPRKSPELHHKLEMAERTRNYRKKQKMEACLEYFKSGNILFSFERYIEKTIDKDGYECWMLSFLTGKKPLRAIFGGKHITLDESYIKCREFYDELEEILAKHLDAGNS